MTSGSNFTSEHENSLIKPAFSPGECCDKYEVVKLIAFGGMGEVYRAVQRSIRREVALKCLQFRHSARVDLKARMENEGKALGRISHPNMVTVFDAGCTDDGVVWIAMELLSGRTLRDVLQGRTLPVHDAVRCAVDVADGVGAAHKEKIIHRDIKPENVFVTDQGAVKVLDLGTAKLQGWGELKTTDRGRVVGTPAYMSPEHLKCIRVNARSDIYALGLVLYEMLGRHPFEHLTSLEDYLELARLQLHGTPRPLTSLLPGFPPDLWKVIQRSLSKHPEERPQSMQEFAAALRAAVGLQAPSLLMAGLASPSPPPVARTQPQDKLVTTQVANEYADTEVGVPLVSRGGTVELPTVALHGAGRPSSQFPPGRGGTEAMVPVVPPRGQPGPRPQSNHPPRPQAIQSGYPRPGSNRNPELLPHRRGRVIDRSGPTPVVASVVRKPPQPSAPEVEEDSNEAPPAQPQRRWVLPVTIGTIAGVIVGGIILWASHRLANAPVSGGSPNPAPAVSSAGVVSSSGNPR